MGVFNSDSGSHERGVASNGTAYFLPLPHLARPSLAFSCPQAQGLLRVTQQRTSKARNHCIPDVVSSKSLLNKLSEVGNGPHVRAWLSRICAAHNCGAKSTYTRRSIENVTPARNPPIRAQRWGRSHRRPGIDVYQMWRSEREGR